MNIKIKKNKQGMFIVHVNHVQVKGLEGNDPEILRSFIETFKDEVIKCIQEDISILFAKFGKGIVTKTCRRYRKHYSKVYGINLQ